ncbi:Uncharacterized protein Adt_37653 [Abeliophyllum distichum]|uniref:Uncharacterized protein n=1 Tax=Abeliophyllum distichum TaxID=126358 RepID=A0ABD1Q009_9LAMI
MLSPKAPYAAYLVFKLAEDFMDLGSVNGIIRFVSRENYSNAEKRATTLNLQSGGDGNGQIAMRTDSWMEVEIGNSYNDQRDYGVLDAQLLENTSYVKSGLIVVGIEF